MKAITIIWISIAAVFLLGFASVATASPFSNRLCRDSSRYSCYTVKRGESWTSLFRDSQERDLVMRINRSNLPIYPGVIIAIPRNLRSANMMDYAPLPRQISPPGEKMILVSLNPNVLAWGAYDARGTLASWGPVSGGRDYCPDIGRGCHSPTGTFRIYQKEGAGCVSTKFPVGRGGAPMPYCMFFHGGFALHGSYEVPGYNASHGCVRLFVPDAKWLNQEFTSGGGVAVVISHNI